MWWRVGIVGQVTEVADCHTFAYTWPCHESASKERGGAADGGGGAAVTINIFILLLFFPFATGRHLHLSNAFNYVKVGAFFSAFFFTFSLCLGFLSFGRRPWEYSNLTEIKQQEIQDIYINSLEVWLAKRTPTI